MSGPGIRSLLERHCILGGGGPREMESTSIATASSSIWSIESLPMRWFTWEMVVGASLPLLILGGRSTGSSGLCEIPAFWQQLSWRTGSTSNVRYTSKHDSCTVWSWGLSFQVTLTSTPSLVGLVQRCTLQSVQNFFVLKPNLEWISRPGEWEQQSGHIVPFLEVPITCHPFFL